MDRYRSHYRLKKGPMSTRDLTAENTELADAEQRSRRIGFAMIFVSVVCNGIMYHFWSAALGQMSPATGIVGIAGINVAFFCLVGLGLRLAGRIWFRLNEISPASLYRGFVRHRRRYLWGGLAAGLSVCFVLGTVKLYGPETAAFLGNGTLVLLVLAGVVLQKEPIGRTELVTIGVILVGAFLFSYQGGALQWGALGLMALGCLTTATKQLTVKNCSEPGNVIPAMLIMHVMMAAVNLPIALVWMNDWPEATGWLLLLGVAASSSLFGMPLLYGGYHRLGVSRGAPLDACRPLVVLLIGLGLGAAVPGWPRLVGGAMVLAGSVVLARRGTK